MKRLSFLSLSFVFLASLTIGCSESGPAASSAAKTGEFEGMAKPDSMMTTDGMKSDEMKSDGMMKGADTNDDKMMKDGAMMKDDKMMKEDGK